MRHGLVCLLAVGLPASLGAQGTEPLRKTDLIRLLASPLIRRAEVADLIRRNCLAFKPTERDWSDLRDLGADADVMSSIGGCTARANAPQRGAGPPAAPATSSGSVPGPGSTAAPAVPAAPPTGSLTLTPAPARVVVTVGSEALVRVQATRNGVPARGAALVLRGSGRVAGDSGEDKPAVTDDSGFAAFSVPVGERPVTHRLEVVTAAGVPLPGRPVVELVVSAGRPASAEVRPARVELSSSQEGPFALQVAVRDSFGNPVAGEPVQLRPDSSDMGIAAATRSTDSLGRVTFLVNGAAVRRTGTVAVRARGERLATFDVVLSTPVAGSGTGFIEGAGEGTRGGVARTQLGEPLVFEARTTAGQPLAGRVVRFRARNAQLARDSAVTDSAGQVRMDVTLGTLVGPAVVTASLDSVQRADTLHVYAGPPVELVLERDGTRVDGGRIIVELGVPFALTVKARDGYGNIVPTAALSRALQDLVARFNARRQLLTALGVESDSLSASLRFQPIALGSTDLTIAVGLSASVSVEVVTPHK